MKTLVCGIAKLENDYIREWVEHYKKIGFTNVVLYDNNDPDGERFEDVIGDYIESGFVILEDCRGKVSYQHPAYIDCYNGMPKGCSDDEFPWERTGAENETKYPYVVHAELNAILNANGRDLRGSKLYVALFPCNECAKAIIQSGVREVVYLSDKYKDTMGNFASKKMLDAAGVKYTRLDSKVQSITLDFVPEENK